MIDDGRQLRSVLLPLVAVLVVVASSGVALAQSGDSGAAKPADDGAALHLARMSRPFLFLMIFIWATRRSAWAVVPYAIGCIAAFRTIEGALASMSIGI